MLVWNFPETRKKQIGVKWAMNCCQQATCACRDKRFFRRSLSEIYFVFVKKYRVLKKLPIYLALNFSVARQDSQNWYILKLTYFSASSMCFLNEAPNFFNLIPRIKKCLFFSKTYLNRYSQPSRYLATDTTLHVQQFFHAMLRDKDN